MYTYIQIDRSKKAVLRRLKAVLTYMSVSIGAIKALLRRY
jgi:hypothetical protein